MSDYIDPENATHLRVFRVSDREWNIDAADDDGGYTEVCWDSRYQDVDGERQWETIPSLAVALELADAYARENVPHLAGTRPKVSLGDLQAAQRDEEART